MAKQLIFYNLANHVSEEEYEKYVKEEKGPLLESLPSVIQFELMKVAEPGSEDCPYSYIGIMHLSSLEEFRKNDAPSQKFQDFMQKWQTMVKNTQFIAGEEVY